MEQLEQEQLDALKSSREKIVNLKSEIADVTILEERCVADKKRLMFEFNQAASEYSKIQSEITEKYGNVSVNLQTGEITHNGD